MSRIMLVLCAVLALTAPACLAAGIFDQEEYPSGFRRSSNCEDILSAEIESLDLSVENFKDLSLSNKIKTIHTLTSDPEPDYNAGQLRDLSNRLLILSEIGAQKLAEFSDELLVIGIELGKFIDNENFPEIAAFGFSRMLEAIVTLPINADEERLMARAGVQANLAQVRITQLQFVSGWQKAMVLEYATKEVQKAMDLGEEAGGQVSTKWLNLPLLIIKTVVQQFDSFDEKSKPGVIKWMPGMLELAFHLRSDGPLPEQTVYLIFDICKMPETKKFPAVGERCRKFFSSLKITEGL